jgi:hypothetical protein
MAACRLPASAMYVRSWLLHRLLKAGPAPPTASLAYQGGGPALLANSAYFQTVMAPRGASCSAAMGSRSEGKYTTLDKVVRIGNESDFTYLTWPTWSSSTPPTFVYNPSPEKCVGATSLGICVAMGAQFHPPCGCTPNSCNLLDPRPCFRRLRRCG